MLPSFEITNFRTFKYLRIERLGRVNLILGENNVWKTTLLEALRLLGSTRPAETVRSILGERNEVRPSVDLSPTGGRMPHYAAESLIHGRPTKNWPPVRIASGTKAECYEVEISVASTSQTGELELRIDSPVGSWSWDIDGRARFLGSRNGNPVELPDAQVPTVDMVSGTAMEQQAGRWWDAVWLRSGRERVLELLRAVAPVRDVTFAADPRWDPNRIAMAQIEDSDTLLPLASLGGGLTRLLHVALATEFAAHRAKLVVDAGSQRRDAFAFLLVDEIDSGIHHVLLAVLWRYILRAARQLDVQVFATTHSWDCLKGLAEAVKDDDQADAQAVRLEEVKGEDQTGAVIIDREGLPIVIRDSIEVR